MYGLQRRVLSARNHLKCCEEITVSLSPLYMVSTDPETRRVGNGYVSWYTQYSGQGFVNKLWYSIVNVDEKKVQSVVDKHKFVQRGYKIYNGPLSWTINIIFVRNIVKCILQELKTIKFSAQVHTTNSAFQYGGNVTDVVGGALSLHNTWWRN